MRCDAIIRRKKRLSEEKRGIKKLKGGEGRRRDMGWG